MSHEEYIIRLSLPEKRAGTRTASPAGSVEVTRLGTPGRRGNLFSALEAIAREGLSAAESLRASLYLTPYRLTPPLQNLPWYTLYLPSSPGLPAQVEWKGQRFEAQCTSIIPTQFKDADAFLFSHDLHFPDAFLTMLGRVLFAYHSPSRQRLLLVYAPGREALVLDPTPYQPLPPDGLEVRVSHLVETRGAWNATFTGEAYTLRRVNGNV